MSVVSALKGLIAIERLGAVITIVKGPDIGEKAVIDAERGLIAGELPGLICDDVLSDALELMEHEQNRTLTYANREIFIETVAPPPVLLIFGAGHIAQPLTVMASLLGFRVIVSDARAQWATPERFPDVDELIIGWPESVFGRVPLDRRTYVVLLSHDVRFEDPVFLEVRRASIRYIGVMGSRRTHRERKKRLVAQGWSEEEICRIQGPVGLDIGAETPEEIAVSILAEMVQIRYGHGTGLSLRGTKGRIHAQRGEEVGTT